MHEYPRSTSHKNLFHTAICKYFEQQPKTYGETKCSVNPVQRCRNKVQCEDCDDRKQRCRKRHDYLPEDLKLSRFAGPGMVDGLSTLNVVGGVWL